MKLSFIFPVCNGDGQIESSVERIMKNLSKCRCDYEILLAEDGSTDGSDSVCRSLSKKYKKVRHLHFKERLGKGLAIKNAMKKARGDAVIFSDIDLSSGTDSLARFVSEIKNGSDICIGSRYMENSDAKRYLKRMVLSKTYILLVRVLFGSRLSDFQCGFKAFSKNAIPVALDAKNNSWFWDTETLLKAEKLGMKITEIPVSWVESGKSSVNSMKVSREMFTSMLKYRIAG